MSDAFSRQAPQCLSSPDWIASKSPRHDGTAAFFFACSLGATEGLADGKNQTSREGGTRTLGEFQFLCDRLRRFLVSFLKIGHKPLSFRDHLEEPPPGMEILLIFFEVIGELLDPLGKHGDLVLRRPGVFLVAFRFFRRFCLLSGRKHIVACGIRLVLLLAKPIGARSPMNYEKNVSRPASFCKDLLVWRRWDYTGHPPV